MDTPKRTNAKSSRVIVPDSSHAAVVFFFLLVCSPNGVECQQPPGLADGLKALESTSFWADSLKVLYELTDTYVRLISKKQAGPMVLKELGIDINNATLFPNVVVSRFNNTSQLPDLLAIVAKNSIPQLTHLVIGFVLFVSLFLCTFLLCCCRSKGCFCGKTGKKKKQGSDKFIIVVLFLLLLAVTATLFLNGMGVAISAKGFSQNFGKSNGSNNTQLVNDFFDILDTTNAYVEALKNETLEILNKEELLKRMDGVVASISGTILRTITNSTGDVFRSLSALTEKLKIMRLQLNASTTLIGELKTSYKDLETLRSAISAKGQAAVNVCKGVSAQCFAADTAYNNFILLRTDALLPDLSSFQSAVNGFTDGELGKALLAGPDGLFSDVTKQLGNVSDTVDRLVEELASNIRNVKLPINKEEVQRNSIFSSVNYYLSQASPYMTTIPIVLATIIFMLVLMNLLGLLATICCASKPAVPQKLFLGAAGTSFPTGSIYVLLAAVLLISTLTWYGEVCMDIERGQESTYLMLADNSIEDASKDLLNSVSFIREYNLTVNLENINLTRNLLYRDCKNNQSLAKFLFQVVEIDRAFTDRFIDSYVRPLLNNALPNDFNLSSTNIFSPQTFSAINATINQLNSLNLTLLSQLALLNDTITAPSIAQMRTFTIAASTQASADQAALNAMLADELTRMEALANETLAKENELATAATNLSVVIEGSASSPSVGDCLQNLTSNLLLLKTGLSGDAGVVSKIKNSSLIALQDEIFDVFEDFKIKFLDSFHCRPLYDLFASAVAIPCHSVLRPLSALWLCLGSYAVLVVPSVICGLWMGGLLVRQKKKGNEVGLMEGDFEDMPRGMRSLPRENGGRLPREDMRRISNRPEYGGDDRRRRRKSSSRDNAPLPPPPSFEDPYRPSAPAQTPLVPTVFPNGLYIPPPLNNSPVYLPRQQFNANGNGRPRSRSGYSPSFLPPYDPFTNYQRF